MLIKQQLNYRTMQQQLVIKILTIVINGKSQKI